MTRMRDGKVVALRCTRVIGLSENQEILSVSQIEDDDEKKYRATFAKQEFGARNGNRERSAVVKNQRGSQREQRILGECWQWESNGQCVKGDNCSFRHDVNKRAKLTQPNLSPSSSTRQSERNASRTRSPRGRSPSGKMFRWPCKDCFKGTAPIHSVKNGTSQNACSARPRGRSGEKCSYAHYQVEEDLSKMSIKNGDKSEVAMLKKHELYDKTERLVLDGCSSSARHLGCVFQDMEPPKSSSILRKSSNIRKPIRCVKFTKSRRTSC